MPKSSRVGEIKKVKYEKTFKYYRFIDFDNPAIYMLQQKNDEEPTFITLVAWKKLIDNKGSLIFSIIVTVGMIILKVG